jgi:hypothetical protein
LLKKKKDANNINHCDRQILCGLFLSKFDQQGLSYLGFDGFAEAFNALGYSLQARHASIKNYRDELDPYFPNARKGWHKRPLREHCKRVLNDYKDDDLRQLGELIKSFLMPVKEVNSTPEVKRVLNIHDSERDVSAGLRHALFTQAWRLERLASQRDQELGINRTWESRKSYQIERQFHGGAYGLYHCRKKTPQNLSLSFIMESGLTFQIQIAKLVQKFMKLFVFSRANHHLFNFLKAIK